MEAPGSTLDEWMGSYGERVLALLRRILVDAEDAKDVAQETWSALWRVEARVEEGADPWPYIRRAAVRKAIDRMRARGARPKTVSMSTEPAAEARPVRGTSHDGTAALHRALLELDVEQRVALHLFFFEGYSIREIAAELDRPEGTVKTRMHRGRARLRELLEQEGYGP